MVSYNRDFMAIILVTLVSPTLVTAASGDWGASSSQYSEYLEDPDDSTGNEGNIKKYLEAEGNYSACCEEIKNVCGKNDPEAIEFARVAMRDWKRGDSNTLPNKFLRIYYEDFKIVFDPNSVDSVAVWCERRNEEELQENEEDTAGTSSQENKVQFDVSLCKANSSQSLNHAFYSTTLEDYTNKHWKYEDYIRLGVTPRRSKHIQKITSREDT